VLGDPELGCIDDEGCIDFSAIGAHLLSECAQTLEECPGKGPSSSGRIGPPDTVVDRDISSGQFAFYGNEGA